MSEKQRIIEEIRRITKMRGDKPPGMIIFEKESGILRSAWCPHLWLRWSEALAEAGFAPNKLQVAYGDDYLAQKFIALIRKIGRLPVKGEVQREAILDNKFPDVSTLYRNGRDAILKNVLRYCEGRKDLTDVAALCEGPLAKGTAKHVSKKRIQTGFVYLMKSGRHYKIGRTVSVGSRERQLAIKIPIPPRTVHSIETDDPVGVEAYWHNRFADRRGEGEWFDLSSEDVAAFKRWKRII